MVLFAQMERKVVDSNGERKFIPRVVKTYEGRLGLNSPQQDNIIKRVNSETWELRYNQLRSPEGYNNGKRVLHCLSIEEWIKRNNISAHEQVTTFIDGHYFYNSINRAGLFVDFAKLRYCPILREKINYFSLYRPDDSKVHRLYTILRKENYHLETKPFDPENQETIMPEMAVRMLVTAYEDEPMVNRMLVMAQDNNLVPAITHLRNTGVKIALGISRTQTVSNFFLNQFDCIIDIVELMQYAECLNTRHIP